METVNGREGETTVDIIPNEVDPESEPDVQLELDAMVAKIAEDAEDWYTMTGIRNTCVIHSLIRKLDVLQRVWGQECEDDSLQIALETVYELQPRGVFEAKLAVSFAGLSLVSTALLCRAGYEQDPELSNAFMEQAMKATRLSMEVFETLERIKTTKKLNPPRRRR